MHLHNAPTHMFATHAGTNTAELRFINSQLLKGQIMESEHLKGAANKAAGKAKQAAGDAMDNKEMQAKGKAQEMKGKVQKAVGDAKDRLEKK